MKVWFFGIIGACTIWFSMSVIAHYLSRIWFQPKVEGESRIKRIGGKLYEVSRVGKAK